MNTKKLTFIGKNIDEKIRPYQYFGYELAYKKAISYKEINGIECYLVRDVNAATEAKLTKLQEEYFILDIKMKELYSLDKETAFLLFLLCIVPCLIYVALILFFNKNIKRNNKRISVLKERIMEEAKELMFKEELNKKVM